MLATASTCKIAMNATGARLIHCHFSSHATGSFTVNMIIRRKGLAKAVFLLMVSRETHAFTPSRLVRAGLSSPGALVSHLSSRNGARFPQSRLFASTTGTLPDVEGMRAGEIKKELESYGISTITFLEKSELVDALKDARDKGLSPKNPATPSSNTASSTSSGNGSSSSSTSVAEDTRPRQERLVEEMQKCETMKAGELKKELEERGISTKSFFEKSEFVKALAEARVDGVEKKSVDSEGYAEYAEVEVLTDESSGPRQGKSQIQPPSPGGGNPFGDAGSGSSGNPFGGSMGGMGGIGDMLKNMGMGGSAAGANPFGGMGGMSGMGGMGDVMGKAQQMMSNPKVRELMAKAQSNPSIMKKMQECMSNPAALAKYQNDPEVAELIKELKTLM
jgi:hypothetical protein